MRKITFLALVLIFTLDARTPSRFYGIPIIYQSKVVDKNDNPALMPLISMTLVTKKSVKRVLDYYKARLGKPDSEKKINHRINLYYKKNARTPRAKNINVLVGKELDGTQITLMFYLTGKR